MVTSNERDGEMCSQQRTTLLRYMGNVDIFHVDYVDTC